MKTFKAYLLLILVMLVLPFPVLADEYAGADKFQRVLMDLKQSIDQLTIDNAKVLEQDEELRKQLIKLRVQLGQIQQEGEQLERDASKLKVGQESKAKQINEAREEFNLLNDHLEKLNDEIGIMSKGVEQKMKEDEALALQVEALRPAVIVPPAPVAIEVKPDPRKEKLKLMKMIYDSKKHQEELHGALLAAQKSAVSTSHAKALARKEYLQGQIKELDKALAELPEIQSPVVDTNWSEDQLQQMEVELKNLQKNHDELALVVGQLQKKNIALQVKPEDRVEQNRLENSINELKREGKALKADLSALRSQMVELDKRKTRLESMLR